MTWRWSICKVGALCNDVSLVSVCLFVRLSPHFHRGRLAMWWLSLPRSSSCVAASVKCVILTRENFPLWHLWLERSMYTCFIWAADARSGHEVRTAGVCVLGCAMYGLAVAGMMGSAFTITLAECFVFSSLIVAVDPVAVRQIYLICCQSLSEMCDNRKHGWILSQEFCWSAEAVRVCLATLRHYML